MCSNKEDLKWCKNATTWPVPDNWKPLNDPAIEQDGLVDIPLLKCSFLQNDTNPQGQWFSQLTKGRVYNCFNRADENPFSKEKNGADNILNNWLQLVKTQCDDRPFWDENERRCLGDRVDSCVDAVGVCSMFEISIH